MGSGQVTSKEDYGLVSTKEDSSLPSIQQSRRYRCAFIFPSSPAAAFRWIVYIYVALLVFLGHKFYPATQVQSVEQFYQLPISSEWFHNPHIHVVQMYMTDSSVSQEVRLEGIRRTLKAAFTAYHAIGLPAFLDSGTLLGVIRNGDLIPWDEDADIGFDADECKRLFPNPGDFHNAMAENIDTEQYHLLGLDCVGQFRVELGHLVLAGKIIDKSNGLYVDQFSYHRIHGNRFERVLPAYRVPYPFDTVFPLKDITLFGSAHFKIPNNSEDFLKIQYDGDIGIPGRWKWRLYSGVGWFTWYLIYALGILSLDPVFGLLVIACKLLCNAGFQFQLIIRAVFACSLGVLDKRLLLFAIFILFLLLIDNFDLLWTLGTRKALSCTFFFEKKPGELWIF